MSDTTAHTNDSTPERIYDTSGLRHDVLQKIFPTSWASEYPGKPRLSRRERRNREQRRIIARKVAEVFDADTGRRRGDHIGRAWRTAAEEMFAKGPVPVLNDSQVAQLLLSDAAKQAQADVDASMANLAAARERATASRSEDRHGRSDFDIAGDGQRNAVRNQDRMLDGPCPELKEHRVALVEIAKALNKLVDGFSRESVVHPVVTEYAFIRTHNSSPSVDDAGAHSVGDGPGAGDASATPATEVTDRLTSDPSKPYVPFNAGGFPGADVTEDSLHTRLTFIQIDEGKAEEIYRAAQANLADAAENLAHARNKTRDAETALNDFTNGSVK